MTSRFRRKLSPERQSVEVLIKHDAAGRPQGSGVLRRAFETASIFGVLLQAAMLAVVAYGVIKTVPIVQHELVKYQSEQRAREIERQEEQIEAGEQALAELTNSLAELRDRERDLLSRAGAAERQLGAVVAELRQAKWNRFVGELEAEPRGTWTIPTSLRHPNRDWTWTDYPLTHFSASDPDLYMDMMTTLQEIRDRPTSRAEVPDEFIAAATAHLERRREFLKCPDIARDRLQAKFQRRLQAEGADPFDVRREFVSYSMALESECARKADIVIRELRQRTPP